MVELSALRRKTFRHARLVIERGPPLSRHSQHGLVAGGDVIGVDFVDRQIKRWRYSSRVPQQRSAIWSHEDTLVEFEVGDGTVTTTEDHEFWNVSDQAWQETRHIDAGDLLLTADGATVEAGYRTGAGFSALRSEGMS